MINQFNEVSLDRAYEFLLDMDTLYRSSEDPAVVSVRFKTSILKKYNVDVLPDLVDLLFKADVAPRLIQVGKRDPFKLMRMCYAMTIKETKLDDGGI